MYNKYFIKALLILGCKNFKLREPFENSTLDKEIEYEQVLAIATELENLDTLKKEGKLYPDTEYKISFTKDDALGLLQVQAAFNLGLQETVMEFSNGTKMPIKAEDFPPFAEWFVNERAQFFTE